MLRERWWLRIGIIDERPWSAVPRRIVKTPVGPASCRSFVTPDSDPGSRLASPPNFRTMPWVADDLVQTWIFRGGALKCGGYQTDSGNQTKTADPTPAISRHG